MVAEVAGPEASPPTPDPAGSAGLGGGPTMDGEAAAILAELDHVPRGRNVAVRVRKQAPQTSEASSAGASRDVAARASRTMPVSRPRSAERAQSTVTLRQGPASYRRAKAGHPAPQDTRRERSCWHDGPAP